MVGTKYALPNDNVLRYGEGMQGYVSRHTMTASISGLVAGKNLKTASKAPLQTRVQVALKDPSIITPSTPTQARNVDLEPRTVSSFQLALSWSGTNTGFSDLG